MSGTAYLITGLLFVVLFFPRPIVLLTMLLWPLQIRLLAISEFVTAKTKIWGQKSLQGSLAAFVVCAILTFAYLATHGMMMDRIVMVSLIGGLIGSFAELIPIWKLDDNLTLPVLSATALWLVFTALGAFSTYFYIR